MARPWGKVWASTLSNRKYLRLSRAERGDWFTLILVAINSTKDDDLGTRDDVRSILRSYGNARPDDAIAQMLNLRLLDTRIGDGHLVLHDWNEHQPDDPTGAKRKAAERAATKAKAAADLSDDGRATVAGQSADSPQNGSAENVTVSRARSREEKRGDRDSPQPPASGGPGSRAEGTSPRAKAKAVVDLAAVEAKAKAWRSNQRKLAAFRGALTEAQQREMDQRDAPVAEIPDWSEHQARLQAEADGVAWLP